MIGINDFHFSNLCAEIPSTARAVGAVGSDDWRAAETRWATVAVLLARQENQTPEKRVVETNDRIRLSENLFNNFSRF